VVHKTIIGLSSSQFNVYYEIVTEIAFWLKQASRLVALRFAGDQQAFRLCNP
jgi:hypothetical protein